MKKKTEITDARKPHFLEVFLPNLCSDRLEVPTNFIKHLNGKHSGLFSMTGPSGNSWNMGLIEHDGNLFFNDGWTTFVKDHSIQCGDTLVFRYDGNSHFSVQIFDQSSCEKEEALYAKCSGGPTVCNGNVAKKRVREREVSSLDDSSEEKHRWTSLPVHPDTPAAHQEKKFKMCVNDIEYSNGTQEYIDTSKKPIVLGLSSVASTELKAAKVNVHIKKHASKGKKALEKKKETGTSVNTSISKFIESRAAHYFNSSFPYFVRVMNYSNISGNSTMKIPMKFSEAHFPNCRIKVTLRNLNGDCWLINSVTTAKKHSTMHTFCGGWIAFVRGNGIKIEDVCIFELVGKFELLVRILRLGVEGLDSQTRSGKLDVCGISTSRLPLETAENVAQHTSLDNFPEDSEQLDGLWLYDHEEHIENAEIVPATQHEMAPFFNTSDDVQKCPISFDPSTKGFNESTDEHLLCNTEGISSCQMSRDKDIDLQDRHITNKQPTAEEATCGLSYSSPFPCFTKVMMNSNIGGSYTVNVPRKFSSKHLPSHKTFLVLRNLKGDSWNVVLTRYGHQTKLCKGWTSFVRKNDVKAGDVCIFELVDEKVLQVRIFKAGDGLQNCVSDIAVADDSTALVLSEHEH